MEVIVIAESLSVPFTLNKKMPSENSEGFLLEDHVQGVSTEPGTGFGAHVDPEFVLCEPFADPGEVVLIQERHVVGLQRMVKIHCHDSKFIAIYFVQY